MTGLKTYSLILLLWKEVIVMDTMKHLNLAMRYIEENLTEEIDFKELSRIACCSEYHFKRVFSFLAGMSLGDYIRRRKIDCATILLRDENKKVIDVAMQLGYESPDAFTKSFQNIHNVTPSQARKGNTNLKAFPPMTFQLKIQGGNIMDYRIVKKEAFKIVGIKKRITLIYEGVNHQMDSMWAELNESKIKSLKELSNIEPQGILCASANFEEGRAEGTELDQYIGVATTMDSEGFEILNVEMATWAVFTAIGTFPQALQNTWARIYAEWLPTSGYEVVQGPEILWNESKDTTLPNYKSEIWIPVIKRD